MAASTLPLAGCHTLHSYFAPAPVKHAKAAKPAAKTEQYDAEAFVLHLSLAKLALASAADTSAAAADLDIVDDYSAQKHLKPQLQGLVVLEYKSGSAKHVQKIAAPVSLWAEDDEFPDLLEILNAMNAQPYTLHDIHLVIATVAPPSAPLKLSGKEIRQAREALDQQEQRLLDGAHKPALLDDARAQMQLIRFFMEYGFRDPAYLAVNNVRQALAAATQNKSGDDDTIEQLSQELDDLEGQLHQTMPFSL